MQYVWGLPESGGHLLITLLVIDNNITTSSTKADIINCLYNNSKILWKQNHCVQWLHTTCMETTSF